MTLELEDVCDVVVVEVVDPFAEVFTLVEGIAAPAPGTEGKPN